MTLRDLLHMIAWCEDIDLDANLYIDTPEEDNPMPIAKVGTNEYDYGIVIGRLDI